jgi:elongation factor Ts
MVTTQQIKELRDTTGVSVMQCKKALEEAGGDMEKAVIILRKVSKAAADKKSDRTLGAGIIASYVHGEGSIGTMVELLCETDFVSRNEEFKALARDIAMHVAAMNPEYLKSEDIKEEDKVKARELFETEAKETGKTGDMLEKIVAGKLDSYFKEKVLLDQGYIKNPEVTIRSLVEQAVQKFGEKVELGRFVRFAVK